jgi:hypothetical protein
MSELVSAGSATTLAALWAALIGPVLIFPVTLMGDYIDKRLRVSYQLLIHLTVALRPGSRLEPPSLRIKQAPDINPSDLWHIS